MLPTPSSAEFATSSQLLTANIRFFPSPCIQGRPMNTHPDTIDNDIAYITREALAKFCIEDSPKYAAIEQFVSDLNEQKFQHNPTFVVEIASSVWRRTRPDSHFREVAVKVHQGLIENTDAFYNGLDYREFSTRNRALWDQAEAVGCNDLVRHLICSSGGVSRAASSDPHLARR